MVAWDDGTQTWEPLNIIGKHDEITLAKYAKENDKENDLLSKPGWKFLHITAKCQRFLNVALNAIKRRRDPTQIRYKFGVRLQVTMLKHFDLIKIMAICYGTMLSELNLIRYVTMIPFVIWGLGNYGFQSP